MKSPPGEKTVPKYCLENFSTILQKKTVFEMLRTARAHETESGRRHQSQDVSKKECAT